MRKNVFLKSMIRQPIHSFLLILLIGLASFAFVMRTAEFMIVRNQISQISAHYRSVGFLQHHLNMGDVSYGADLLSDDINIASEDRRRAFEGFMEGILSANVAGSFRFAPRETHTRLNDAFFLRNCYRTAYPCRK